MDACTLQFKMIWAVSCNRMQEEPVGLGSWVLRNMTQESCNISPADYGAIAHVTKLTFSLSYCNPILRQRWLNSCLLHEWAAILHRFVCLMCLGWEFTCSSQKLLWAGLAQYKGWREAKWLSLVFKSQRRGLDLTVPNGPWNMAVCCSYVLWS